MLRGCGIDGMNELLVDRILGRSLQAKRPSGSDTLSVSLIFSRRPECDFQQDDSQRIDVVPLLVSLFLVPQVRRMTISIKFEDYFVAHGILFRVIGARMVEANKIWTGERRSLKQKDIMASKALVEPTTCQEMVNGGC